MKWRPDAIALARAVNALFFLAVSAYCLVAYTPFAYELFIKPAVVPALNEFVAVSPWLFWATLLTTILTLMPQLSARGARGGGMAWSYVAVGLVVGVLVLAWPPMVTIGRTPKAFALAMAALVWPMWLAAIDHRIWPARNIHAVDSVRVLMACGGAAVISCAAFGVTSPLRIGQMSGIDLPPVMLAAAVGSSLVLDLFVFMALFLAILTMTGVSRLMRAAASTEYWLQLLLLLVCGAAVVYLLVFASLAFSGGVALFCSIAFGGAMAAVWADLARLRSQPSPVAGDRPDGVGPPSIDSVALVAAPVAGVGSRKTAVGVLVALPFIAFALVDAVRQLDWNFLLQKFSVLVVWLLAFASVYALVGERRTDRPSPVRIAALPIVALVLYHVVVWVNPETAIDRYVAIEPSLRLIRDARTAQSSTTADFYNFLRSHTLLYPRQVQPSDIDFVKPLRRAERAPSIFLIIVDSMRRDYLSVYNPEAAFTPEIEKLAAESFVFERAWTRYSGTALAIPAIWAGGMVPHMVVQPDFPRRNPLLKLLDANDYLRLMDIDVHVEELVPRGRDIINLDPDKGTMDLDLCTTVRELERTLSRERKRPAFFYSLPQNVHLAVATKRKVPAGETYPPRFDERMASSLHRLDGCLGGLVDYLKREQMYDDSVIILTSDHGDSLGEEGRWGHAFWMYPEVMNIPLIVHVPSWLKSRFRADLDALVFSTDIVPSLYTLLGYEPKDLGPVFGRSFFTPRDSDSSRRRREPFLLASSYGAVYGVASQNGRRMYVVDTVNATEYALDMTGGSRRLVVTPPMIAANRRVIEQQLSALAAAYHYQP